MYFQGNSLIIRVLHWWLCRHRHKSPLYSHIQANHSRSHSYLTCTVKCIHVEKCVEDAVVLIIISKAFFVSHAMPANQAERLRFS